MVFNSINFILIFLPLALAAFHLSPPRFRPFVIAASSALFYSGAGNFEDRAFSWPFVFMCLSIVWAYCTALLFQLFHTKWVLLLSIIFPAGVLYLFRYLGFTLTTVGMFEELSPHFSLFLDVLLPAGISFYSFQIMAYSIDVYDRKVKPDHNFIDVFAYISFFPQLIAGPILRYEQLCVQIKKLRHVKSLHIDWSRGLKFFAYGLFFKVFVADRFAVVNDSIFPDSPALDIVYLIFSYSFRIYFDFWAYSTMAIGIACFFGINLPKNFLEPYLSLNPRDFWRRWHVTLSYWLRDYFFIKIGGNRAYVRNIIIVFGVCGLWHGAGFNFIVWGLYHAALVIGYKATQGFWDRLPSVFQVSFTFILVSIGWPLFIFQLPDYVDLLSQLLSLSSWSGGQVSILSWAYLFVVGAFLFGMREEKWLDNSVGAFRFAARPEILAIILFACVIGTGWSRTFIYFRF